MITLTIIYLSFATGDVTWKQHAVPAEACQAIYEKTRRHVRAGRIWGICHQ